MIGVLDFFKRRHGRTPAEASLCCSFCGKRQDEVRKLIAGSGGFICNDCVKLCTTIIREEGGSIPSQKGEVPTRDEIRAVLDQEIDGQDSLKRELSFVLHKHLQNLAAASSRTGAHLSPVHILLRGPSMGRSDLARALTRRLAMPFAMVNAAELLECSGRLEVCQLIARRLLNAGCYNSARSAEGLVYIDDFDVLCRHRKNNPGSVDRIREEAQEAIASLMAGAVVPVPAPAGHEVSLDTSTTTFMCAGVFFGVSDSTSLKQDFRLPETVAEALVEFGLRVELVERLSGVVSLESAEQ